MSEREQRLAELHQRAKENILVLDGAMGTMIQDRKLTEEDFRGDRFADHGVELRGNGEVLSLTQPDIIADIHAAYLEAGADIVATNTFTASSISQSDYGLEDVFEEMNFESARLARSACDAFEAQNAGAVRFVVGVLGPTNRTASISPDVNDPGFRNVTFDELRATYHAATTALAKGGADIVMVETIFDTLNAKAALFAIEDAFEELGFRLPIMISGTITDLSGRTLSGQTPEAFWNSVKHVRPFSIGLNCALGAKEMRAYVGELSKIADCYVSAHPNAGLPNEFGGYDETPEMMGEALEEFVDAGLVNIIGGCCGTTPDHIREFAVRAKGKQPRSVPQVTPRLRLSGLEPFAAATM